MKDDKHNGSVLFFLSGVLMIISAFLLKQYYMIACGFTFIIIGIDTWQKENKKDKTNEIENNKEKDLGENKDE